jgi:Xaa-Pro aminopeptidase
MTDRHQLRRDRVRRAVRKAGAEAILVTDFTNVTYLTGFTGDDSYLLIRDRGEMILSDPRYTTQLNEQCPGLEVHIRKPGVSMVHCVGRVLRAARTGRLAVEGDSLAVATYERIQSESPRLETVTTTGLVERLRRIKDKDEISQIRQAIWFAEKGFAALRATLHPEQSERDAANELEHLMRQFGARAAAFPSIVAVGARSALPHATPTDGKIGSGDFTLVDWGANGGLYRSDLTRVLVTGKIMPKLERVYRVVLKAQLHAIAAICPGAVAADIDRTARNVIAEAGFGRYFGHGLGHGLGLQVHEAPRLTDGSRTVLKPGMVVTVEPGIYLPGWGGVRIEDDVLVTRTGHEVLTAAEKQLEEMLVR